MELQYYKVDPNYHRERYFVCPHNDGVKCSQKNCYNCGWYPKTAKYRFDKIVKAMQKVGGKK